AGLWTVLVRRPRGGPSGVPGGRLLAVAGTRVHVVEAGAGAPVVLLGGVGDCWFGWDDVVRDLLAGDGYRTIFLDRPGLGLSDYDARPRRLEDEAALVYAVLGEVGVGEPAVVVGHSYGGSVAEAFGRLYPAATAALVLAD